MRPHWLAALSADPCRLARAMLDWRSVWRLMRQVRTYGMAIVRSELLTLDHPSLSRVDAIRSGASPGRDLRSGKTILVIDRAIPQFDRDAGSRSSHQYLQLFSEMGLRVLFLPHDQMIRQPYAGALCEAGIEILAGKGIRCGGWKRWLKENKDIIDFVFLHRPNVARYYLPYIQRICQARTFYYGHDLRYRREMRQYLVEGDVFCRLESKYWERIETRLCQQADVSFFFSDTEVAEIKRRLPTVKVRRIPLFLDGTGRHRENRVPLGDRAGLLFVGNFVHSPNVDGVQWFVRHVLPIVREHLPLVRTAIVGANPPDRIRMLQDESVAVYGAVSDESLCDHYAKTRVVVVPLRFGAGIKGKVVEALQHGVPVVTTSVGAEGIPEDVLTVADSAEEFAAAVSDLLSNSVIWHRARQESAEAIDRCFSSRAALEIFNEEFLFDESKRETSEDLVRRSRI